MFVSHPDVAGSGTEAHARQRSSRCVSNILQVLAHRLGIPQIVILVHETLVEALTRGAPDHAQIEGLEGYKRTRDRGYVNGNLRRSGFLRREPGKLPFLRRERDEPLSVELQHESPADHILRDPIRLGPVPLTAEFL